jgi:hypothetical protein
MPALGPQRVHFCFAERHNDAVPARELASALDDVFQISLRNDFRAKPNHQRLIRRNFARLQHHAGGALQPDCRGEHDRAWHHRRDTRIDAGVPKPCFRGRHTWPGPFPLAPLAQDCLARPANSFRPESEQAQ